MKYKITCGRQIALELLVLLMAIGLCACREDVEDDTTELQAVSHIQYELRPSEAFQSIELTEQESLTVLGGRDGYILATLENRYPEGHPYATEMGMSVYGSSLLMADLSGRSRQVEYTFPNDTVAREGTIFSDGVVIAQLSNAGELVFDYEILQIADGEVNSVWEGRCTDVCGLAVLSDRAIVHAYQESLESFRQGVVITSLDGKEVGHWDYSSISGASPCFCADETRFAFAVHEGDAPIVLIGDDSGLQSSFSLNAGETISHMAFLDGELLLLVGSTDFSGNYVQRRELWSLDGGLILEDSGSKLFQLCTNSENSVAGLSNNGLVLIWEESERLSSEFIPMETAFHRVIPLASDRCLIYDSVSLSSLLLQVG